MRDRLRKNCWRCALLGILMMAWGFSSNAANLGTEQPLTLYYRDVLLAAFGLVGTLASLAVGLWTRAVKKEVQDALATSAQAFDVSRKALEHVSTSERLFGERFQLKAELGNAVGHAVNDHLERIEERFGAKVRQQVELGIAPMAQEVAVLRTEFRMAGIRPRKQMPDDGN
ncbi:hypothetical protein [uncultured Arenimonas sp.]|uniref:hypothetical protein n=1 Tax=uncultured Arenimonas sp. TaxID=546226 RepID=UPI0030D82B98